MLDVCFFILGVTGIAFIFYFLLEIHYFLRTFLSVIIARFFKKRRHVLDSITVTGICLTNDVDYLLDHMNNARYLRELDFAKIDFYERTQLYNKIVAKGGSIFAGATTIRYRRFIKLFSKYKIITKVIYWDDQNIYMEHRFVSNNFVNAIALCRQRLVKINVEELMSDLIQNHPKNIANVDAIKKQKPEFSPDLEKWIESNQISSDKLREETSLTEAVIEAP